ncbi:TIGR03915 family putative DNA repair protein [Petroclostridium sp. X23]|uniref:TIGR03915 family putative DNA repair protein n=1 Tax=Petroclostridium sp. X23 TaxID=3045146 RepID=UPI0024AC9155|nr:TIGR03915 family putative DNA repair protein [Petroclostridium sp. X23]WHH61021.1 TIGR03915 family putative DNA repair protein [Petroclostridium sp. X23]
MLNYIYDGTFEGLLTAIYEAYYRRQVPEKIVSQHGFQQELLYENIYIETDDEKADKVYLSIREKISPQALQHVFYVFLSECDEAGTWIYQYLRLGWKVGRKVDMYEADDRVLAIHRMSRKVSGEAHRLLGLIRFRHVQGDIYYAPIEPDYNIIALMAPHFVKRFGAQNWIIHDIKRKLAAMYDQKNWIITDFIDNADMNFEETEVFYQKLWKKYFESIAIKSRINPRLQRRCMPARYWRYLIELKN